MKDATTCENCPRGFNQIGQGQASCIQCSPGRFSSTGGNTECEACPSGYLQSKPQKFSCDPVKAGQIVATGGSASIVVPQGSKIDDSSESGFKACPAGAKGNTPPNTFCVDCPMGMSSTPGAIECVSCDKGKYSDELGIKCKDCNKETFQDQNTKPSSTCFNCPSGYHQPAKGSAACISLNWKQPSDCTAEQYLDNRFNNPSTWNCSTCPDGGACVGPIMWNTLEPLFGWWKIPEKERVGTDPSSMTYQMFAKCIYPSACLGAVNPALKDQYSDSTGQDLAMAGLQINANNSDQGPCATRLGFRNQSRLCHTCANNAKRKGVARCEMCPTDGQNVGLMVLGFILIVGAIVFLVSSSIEDAGQVKLSESIQKILLNFLQVIAFAAAFPLRWPSMIEGLFEFQGSISTLGEHLLNPDCLATTQSAAELFYSKQAMYATSPFLVALISFVFWYVKGQCAGTPFFEKRSQMESKRGSLTNGQSNAVQTKAARAAKTTPKDKFIVTICTVIYLMFPTLCTQAFSMFHCRTVAGQQFLAADMEEPCYEGRHLIMVVFLGLTQLLAFVFGLPALVYFFLHRNKHLEGGGLDKHVTIVRYGLFYGAYKDDTYYWEIIITGRKISIVALSVFGSAMGIERQAQMVIAVLFVCISLEISGDP